MSVARNSMNRFPYYTYKEVNGFGNGLNGFRQFGAAASPTAAIVVGSNSAPNSPTFTPGGSVIKTSTDGIVWSDVATTSFGNNAVTQIAYGNDVFVAMGGGNTIATSPGTSGTTWTQRTSPASGTAAWGYLTFQNGIFVAVNTASIAYTSTDGITWTAGAAIDTTGLTTMASGGSNKGGLFYIANNPLSARWLHCYGRNFATASQTHFALYQDITSSGTISSTYATDNSGSQGPQWIADDYRLLVSVASMTTAGFTGHASSLSPSAPTSQTANQIFPSTITPSGVFFPSLLPRVGQIAIGASTASTVVSQFQQLATISSGTNGGNTGKKARYIYNDGYYNCLFVGTGEVAFNTLGGIYASPTVNVAFRADDPSLAESVQIIGNSTVPQAGVGQLGSNLARRVGGFERSIDITFKGNSYVFFIWYDSSDIWTHGYLRGTRSIKPLRTTIGLGV